MSPLIVISLISIVHPTPLMCVRPLARLLHPVVEAIAAVGQPGGEGECGQHDEGNPPSRQLTGHRRRSSRSGGGCVPLLSWLGGWRQSRACDRSSCGGGGRGSVAVGVLL